MLDTMEEKTSLRHRGTKSDPVECPSLCHELEEPQLSSQCSWEITEESWEGQCMVGQGHRQGKEKHLSLSPATKQSSAKMNIFVN